MKDKKIITGMLMDENTTISFVEICQKYDISEALLTEMVEHGLFTITEKNLKHVRFNYETVSRILSAQRLQKDLGVNVPGVVLALELLDELEQLRKELSILQRHVDM